MDLSSTVSARTRTLAGLTVVLLLSAVLVSCTSTAEPDHEATGAGAPLSSAEADDLATEVADYLGSQDIFDDVRAVIVATGDDVVLAEYQLAGPEDFFDTESVTKSVISTLVGIAIDQGLIDGRRRDPRRAVAGRGDAARPGRHDARRGADDDRWLRRIVPGAHPGLRPLARLDAGHPGRRRPAEAAGSFAYSNDGAHLLSAVLTEATGTSVLAYARRVLLDPLGVDTRPAAQPLAVRRNAAAYEAADFAWPVDPQGRALGWSLLKLRPEDLLAFGRLHLEGGRLGGQAAGLRRLGRRGHAVARRGVRRRGGLRLPVVGRRGRRVAVVPGLGVRRAAGRGGARA